MNLEEIVKLANNAGMAYVGAKKESERLELLKPTMRARAMEAYDNGERTEAKIRRLAEVDSEYVQFIERLAAAKSESERTRIRYESFKNLFEARRSMLSYQKAEMRIT